MARLLPFVRLADVRHSLYFQTYISLSNNQIGGFKPESGGFRPSFWSAALSR
jgi:hypothetical protein